MKSLLVLVLMGLSSISFGKTYMCDAYGNKGVGGNEDGPFTVKSKLELKFRNSDHVSKARVRGYVMVAEAREKVKSPEDLDGSNSYMAIFDDSFYVNKKYNPSKYKTYTQLRGVKAKHTHLNRDMRGNLVFPKKAKDRAHGFHMAYIFRVSDRTGGTIHFQCEEYVGE